MGRAAGRKSKRWIKHNGARRLKPSASRQLTPDEELDIRDIMMGVMHDPFVHAKTILNGRTNFRNMFLAGLAGLRRQQEAMVRENKGHVNGSAARLRMLDRMSSDVIAEYGWRILTTWGWQETLARLSAALGYADGYGLPPTTTPQMVYDHIERPPEPEPEPPPEKREIELNTNLNPADMGKLWHTSRTELKGPMHEIAALSKAEDVKRGIKSGAVEIVEN